MPGDGMQILSLIGSTPMVKLTKLWRRRDVEVYVKLEYMNPTGSHKDRIALYMLKDAAERGLLKPGGVVVEASSGNTAISVAWLASLMGYRPVIVMEEGASPAKVAVVKALGAEVIFAPRVPYGHPEHAENVARRVARERRGVFLNQCGNEANIRAHYETTAREIYSVLGSRVRSFVMGIGTGGTLIGVAKFFRDKGLRVRIVGVVPRGSPIATGRATMGERIEGLAATMVPEIYAKYSDLVDEVVEVGFEEAWETALRLAREEGILGGPSTGANVAVALKEAEALEEGAVVTIAPDSIFRYAHLLDSAIMK
ncbi:MAG: cysteine synthase A [Thermoprotei archaeon]|nr:MAG: cysteine synthase A [Thermoprotei archaeon]